MNKIKLEGLDLMRSRLNPYGGVNQQQRMISDKANTLEKALLYSYQATDLKKEGSDCVARGLIEPNKTKPDYDDKILSLPLRYECQPGDIFEWCGTNTQWLVYLQDLTEKAYFKGDIRRCNYFTEWKTSDGQRHHTYMAVRGPVETTIQHIKREYMSLDTPNRSLNIMIPKTEENEKYFIRYAKFYLHNDPDTCWRVTAVDGISTPGIIEFHADEYYKNDDEDDNGIVGELIPRPAKPLPSDIVGEDVIYPNMIYDYLYDGVDTGEWHILEHDAPVKLVSKNNKAKIKWNAYYAGTFTLQYGNHNKVIKVNTLRE